MKKTFRILTLALTIISVLSALLVMASAVEVPSSYIGASDYLITDGTSSSASQPIFKDGKVTFKINLASGVTVTGALVTVKFDKNVLRIVDAGPVTVADEDGNKTEVITGMHTHGYAQYDDSAYTFAYISANGYKTGDTGKEFAYITFEVIDKNYPLTTVEFVAGDYSSTDTIKEFKDFTTIDAGRITSFVAGKNSITINWNEIKGATEYLLYRKGGEDSKFRVIATVSGLTYTDSENIENNTKYTYAVRGKSKAGDYGWYIGKSFNYIDTVKITVTNEKSGVRIAWDKVDGATAFSIQKRVAGESVWMEMKKVEGDVLAVTDKDVTSGVTYEYSVIVYKGESASAKSDAVKIKCVAIVPKVTLANHADGVSIKWSEVKGAQKYCVLRKVKGETVWTELETLSNKTKSYIDKGATTGTVNYYAVKAYIDNTWSSYDSYAINYLAAPRVKKAYSDMGKGITLQWDAVAGAAKYRVYKKTGSESFKLIATTVAPTFNDKDVKLGKKYIYTVKSENGKNISGCVKPGWTVKYTLKTPEISEITNTTNSIKIKWKSVSGAEGYKVYRKVTGEGNYKCVATVKGASYTDKNVKKGVKYSYTVKAYKGKVVSECKKSTSYVGIILATPSVTAKNATTGMKITWKAINGAEKYKIYRADYDAKAKKWLSYETIETVEAKTLSYTDKGVTSGEKYKYKVKAYNGKCKSSTKATSTALYVASTKTTVTNKENGINVSWTKVRGAEKYKVYRMEYDVSAGKWSSAEVITTVSSKTLSYHDKSVEDGRTYKYRVRAIKGKTYSSYKTTGEIVFLTSPELISCESIEKSNVLVWGKVEGATGYEVYRKTIYTDWVLIGTVEGAGNATYKDADIIENTEYIYTVKAVNGDSISSFNQDGISC